MNPVQIPSTKVTAGAVGGAFSVVAVWLVKLTGVEVPAEVAVALSTVLSFLLGYAVKDTE